MLLSPLVFPWSFYGIYIQVIVTIFLFCLLPACCLLALIGPTSVESSANIMMLFCGVIEGNWGVWGRSRGLSTDPCGVPVFAKKTDDDSCYSLILGVICLGIPTCRSSVNCRCPALSCFWTGWWYWWSMRFFWFVSMDSTSCLPFIDSMHGGFGLDGEMTNWSNQLKWV